MSFGWTVADNTTRETRTLEQFSGYFTDIQRVARKSLPRQPSKDLCSLLGLPSTYSQAKVPSSICSTILSGAPQELIPVGKRVAKREPYGAEKEHPKSNWNLLKEILLCKGGPDYEDRKCSKRERTACACAIYFAVIIFILLVIIVILVAILNASSEKAVTDHDGVSFLSTVNPQNKINTTEALSSKTTEIVPSSTSREQTLQSTESPFKSSTDFKQINTTVRVSSQSQRTAAESSPSISVSTATPIENKTTSSVQKTTHPPPRGMIFDFDSFSNCSTNDCKAAQATVAMVDTDMDPCNDMYSFACGGWERQIRSYFNNGETNVPRTLQEHMQQNLKLQLKDMLSAPLQENSSFSASLTKTLYQTCLSSTMNSSANNNPNKDVELLHELLDVLAMTGNGTFTLPAAEMLHVADIMFQVNPLFRVSFKPLEQSDGTFSYGIQLDPPRLYLPITEYVDPETEIAANYMTAMSNVLYRYVSTFKEYDFLFDMDKVREVIRSGLNFEKMIASLEQASLENQGTVTQVVITTNGLKAEYPNIPWEFASEATMVGNALVQVNGMEYFKRIDYMYSTTQTETIQIYVFLTVMKAILHLMPMSLRSELQNAYPANNMVDTELDCVEVVLRLAKEEAHTVFVAHYAQRILDDRLAISGLVDSVNSAFQRLVENASWIRSDLKRVVAALSRNIRVVFSPLRTTFEDLAYMLTNVQSFAVLALELRRRNHEAEIKRLGTNLTQVEMLWTSTEPVFESSLYIIGLPTGLSMYLQSGYSNFNVHGYLGTMMAKEFVTLLTGDLTDGKTPLWWGTQNSLSFKNVTTCFAEQISSKPAYSSTSNTMRKVFPGTTLTEEEIFIFNTVQSQCHVTDGPGPGLVHERINNMLKNTANLAAFGCVERNNMTSTSSCQLFTIV